MGIVAVLTGYAIYRLLIKLLRVSSRSRFIAGFVAGLLSLGLAGTLAGLEIGFSGEMTGSLVLSLEKSVPTMSVAHFALGIVEGLITGSVVSYLGLRDPSSIYAEAGLR